MSDHSSPSSKATMEIRAGYFANSLTISPLLISVGFLAGFFMLWAGPFDLIFAGLPTLLMIWGFVAVLTLIFAVAAAAERAWLKSGALLILPAVFFLFCLNFGYFFSLGSEQGARLRIWVKRPNYLKQIALLPASGAPRLAVFERGGFAAVGKAVVYDESDEIVLPPERQSDAWKKLAAVSALGCVFSGSSLGGHFYIVSAGC